MTVFGWISQDRILPREWDLRWKGWTYDEREPDVGYDGKADQGTHPLLCDYQSMPPARLAALRGQRQRIVLLGVEGSLERAGLLAARYGDVLPAATMLDELAERAGRLAEQAETMPRYRMAGPVMLDLFHRDARVDGRWLGLHPREFALLWHLAERPGTRVTRRDLLTDVWRLQHEPETNRVEVHVSRLRGKLAGAGVAGIVATDPRGGYHLAVGSGGERGAIPLPAGGGLDAHVRRAVIHQAPQDEGI